MLDLFTDMCCCALLREVNWFREYRELNSGRPLWLWSFLGVRLVEALNHLDRSPSPFGRN